jgi:hypothetical protein
LTRPLAPALRVTSLCERSFGWSPHHRGGCLQSRQGEWRCESTELDGQRGRCGSKLSSCPTEPTRRGGWQSARAQRPSTSDSPSTTGDW